MSSDDSVNVEGGRLKLLVSSVRELMKAEPGPNGRNAFRLEDWSEWPNRWRTTYEILGRVVVAGGRGDDAGGATARP